MKIVLGLTAAVAALGLSALAVPASAHGGYGYSYPCGPTKKTGRATGGVVGAIAGGLVGSNVAPTGKRAEGTLIGAAAGAVIGAKVNEHKERGRCYAYEPEHHGGYGRGHWDHGRHRGWYKD
jgi:phage tail tape-measure protein